jgi:hypothetical protein
MVRHFLLMVGVPGEARKLLGRLVNGDESEAPQITRLRTGTSVSNRGEETIPRMSHAIIPTTA